MPCETVTLADGDGGTFPLTVCLRGGRHPRIRPCVACGAPATLLCDGPRPRGRGTCDAPLCAACAVHRAPDADFCPRHAAFLAAPDAAAPPR